MQGGVGGASGVVGSLCELRGLHLIFTVCTDAGMGVARTTRAQEKAEQQLADVSRDLKKAIEVGEEMAKHKAI